ncbi:MAG: peptide deformylase [Blastocatellia bacterium]|nr:peptide deformylase [Blastocatellia bacterium]MBL8193316.1 peptide deformylase [Blastocatellia bacterium]MBN8722992.1 peptide deformylase [Acidobacteriota bacterium]
MILPIVKYGELVLTKKAAPVTEFNEELQELVKNMFETMYAAPGVGLAAPQIGVSKRLFVMDCSGGKNPEEKLVLINPEIVQTEGKQTGDEGCLSFPNIYFEVTRPKRLVARAFDATGKEFTIDAMDLTARCIAHENDHLNGELFIQYLGPLKRELVMRKIKKRIKLGDWK